MNTQQPGPTVVIHNRNDDAEDLLVSQKNRRPVVTVTAIITHGTVSV